MWCVQGWQKDASGQLTNWLKQHAPDLIGTLNHSERVLNGVQAFIIQACAWATPGPDVYASHHSVVHLLLISAAVSVQVHRDPAQPPASSHGQLGTTEVATECGAGRAPHPPCAVAGAMQPWTSTELTPGWEWAWSPSMWWHPVYTARPPDPAYSAGSPPPAPGLEENKGGRSRGTSEGKGGGRGKDEGKGGRSRGASEGKGGGRSRGKSEGKGGGRGRGKGEGGGEEVSPSP